MRAEDMGWSKLQPGKPAAGERSRNWSDIQAHPQWFILLLKVGGILGGTEAIPLRALNTEELEAWVFFLLLPALLSD